MTIICHFIAESGRLILSRSVDVLGDGDLAKIEEGTLKLARILMPFDWSVMRCTFETRRCSYVLLVTKSDLESKEEFK